MLQCTNKSAVFCRYKKTIGQASAIDFLNTCRRSRPTPMLPKTTIIWKRRHHVDLSAPCPPGAIPLLHTGLSRCSNYSVAGTTIAGAAGWATARPKKSPPRRSVAGEASEKGPRPRGLTKQHQDLVQNRVSIIRARLAKVFHAGDDLVDRSLALDFLSIQF